MNQRQKIQTLPTPGPQYTQDWAQQFSRALDTFMEQSAVPGQIVGVNPLLLQYPTNGYGLPSGSTWVDGDGFNRTVRDQDVFAPTFLIRIRPVKVTIGTS